MGCIFYCNLYYVWCLGPCPHKLPLTFSAPTILPSRPPRVSPPLGRDAPATHSGSDGDLFHFGLPHLQDGKLQDPAMAWLRHLGCRLRSALHHLTLHLDCPARRVSNPERHWGRTDVPDQPDGDPGEYREGGHGGGDGDAEFPAVVGRHGGAGWMCCYFE